MQEILSIIDDNNNFNPTSFLESFDSEPGYYHHVIRSMLIPGHESELIYWFKTMGLIPNYQVCINAPHRDECNKLMEWTPAKVIDCYQWRCKSCGSKKSIREGSIFHDIKACSFKNAIRILLGWCKGYDIETMANILGVKKHSVNVLFNTITNTAKKNLRSVSNVKKIGGKGVVVIIDTYPEGCTNYSRTIRGTRPILCIAEAKTIPPTYWFEALQRYNNNNIEQISLIKCEILKTIEDIVLPGSIIVTKLESKLCSYYDLQQLKQLYPIIVTIENLSQHNNENQTIIANLETIWKLALNICEEAQFYSFNEIPNFLISQMWKNRFHSESFEMILNQLVDLQ